MKGWISIHRKLEDNPIFQNEKALKIWIWCLIRANHTETDVLLGRSLIHLKVGQFIFGSDVACERLKMSKSTIHFWLDFLKVERYIERKTTNKYSIITVLNYSKYQKLERQVEYKWNAKRTPSVQQIETDNNVDTVNTVNNDRDTSPKTLKGNAKTSLVPCTNEELYNVALLVKTKLDNVLKKHTDILLLIRSGEFQQKYKDKTLYYTLIKWLRGDIAKGYIEPMNDFEELTIKSFHPETGNSKEKYSRYWSYCKEMGVI